MRETLATAQSSTVILLGPHPVTGLSVDRHGMIEVVSPVAFSLEATAGQVWLTRDRVLRDDVLGAGQRIDLPANQRVVLSGLPVATVDLIPRKLDCR